MTKEERLERLGKRISALVGRPAFWVVVLGIAFLLPLGRALAMRGPVAKAPEMSLPLPDFRVTDQHGLAFGSKELRGRIWVASFAFTSCARACDDLMRRLYAIQDRSRGLGDTFHLVTFTIDPAHDTPEALAAFALQHRASASRWSFLTSAGVDIDATLARAFGTPWGQGPSATLDPRARVEGEELVLVDPRGNVRGRYAVTDAGVDALLRDAGLIANGP